MRETLSYNPLLDSVVMVGERLKNVPSGPLFRRIARPRGAARDFAAKLNISQQVLSNWRKRGFPGIELQRVAAALGITAENYLREAGVVATAMREPVAQYTLEAAKLMEDFNALPDWLQAHIARKTAELRKYADSLPPFVRDGMKGPPKDPQRYREWERDIVDSMEQLSKNNAKPEDK